MKRNEAKPAFLPYILIRTLAKLSNIYEVRLFGWIMAKAQAALKLYNHDLMAINIEFSLDLCKISLPVTWLMGQDRKNHKHAFDKAKELATKTVEYEKNDFLYHLNIIAFPQLRKTRKGVMFECYIHQQMWYALLDNFKQGHRIINLASFVNLSSTYSCCLYWLVSQQKTTIDYKFETLRELTGATAKAYERVNNFKARILDAAKKELDDKAPHTFTYTYERGGLFHLTSQPNKNYKRPADEIINGCNDMRCRLPQATLDFATYAFTCEPRDLEKIENYILMIGNEQAQLQRLQYIAEKMRQTRANNPIAYLTKAIKNTNA